MDLEVPVHRLLAAAAPGLALLREPIGELGDGLREARLDGGEVPLVARDQPRVCLGSEAVRQVEGTGHVITPI